MIPYPHIDPVAFTILGFAVHWYGLAYIVGIFVGLKQCRFYALKYCPELAKIEDISGHIVIGILLGGRLGHILFYDLQYFIDNPYDVPKLWLGGMSFHGGLIGGIIAIWFFCRKIKQPFLKVCDLLATATPIGLGLGRLANFINGELYGSPTHLPWGIVFPQSGDGMVRHPSQLYEMFLEGVILYIVTNMAYKKWRIKQGVTLGVFMLGYGLFRFMIELVRDPSDGYWWIFTKGQALCVPMMILGIGLIFYQNIKKLLSRESDREHSDLKSANKITPSSSMISDDDRNE